MLRVLNIKEGLENSKLITLLKQLNKLECKKLEHFIKSEFFFPKIENAHYLLLEVISYHGKYEKLHKKSLYRLIFNKPYNDNNMRKELTHALQIVEQFIAHKNLDANKVQQDIVVAQYYGKQGLDIHFNTIKKRIIEGFDKKTKSGGGLGKNDFYKLFLLENIVASFKQKGNDLSAKPFRDIIKRLDYFYLAARLKESCSVLIQQKRAQDTYDSSYNSTMIDFIESDEDFLGAPVIQAYYNIFKAFKKGENTKECIELLNNMLKKSDISLFEKQEIFTSLSNIIIGEISQGNYDYYIELFELYKTAIKQKLVNDAAGKVKFEHVKNIITAALQVDKVAWAKDFLEKNKSSIDKNTMLYNRANIYFHQKDYNGCYQLLSEYLDSDKARNKRLLFYKVATRRLVIKTFYEATRKELKIKNPNTTHIPKEKGYKEEDKNEYDPVDLLYPAIQNFKRFIKAQKSLAEKKRNRNFKFVQILEQVYKLLDNKEKHDKLKKTLEEDKTIYERLWLIKKLEERNK